MENKQPAITRGNKWNGVVPLFLCGEGGEKTPLDVALIDNLDVVVKNNFGKVIDGVEFVGVDNLIIVEVPDTLIEGVYSLSITGELQDNAMRYARKYSFSIVDWSEQSNLCGVVSGKDVPLEDALFVLVTDSGDIGELEQELREKIAEAEAEKAEWQQKVAELTDVAKETTSQSILAKLDAIHIDLTPVLQAIESAKAYLKGKLDDAVTTLGGWFTSGKQEILTKIETTQPDLSAVAKEATLNEQSQAIKNKIDNIPAPDLSSVAKQGNNPNVSLSSMDGKLGNVVMMTDDERQPAKEDALSRIVWHDDNE